MKKNIAVFFGGRSVEHDVSIITGLQIIENADKDKYDAYPVYISREGEWFCGEKLRDVQFYKNFDPEDKGMMRVFLKPGYRKKDCGILRNSAQRHTRR